MILTLIEKLININIFELNLNCSLEISLEKYKKIISMPLIIIRKVIIEYIKLNDHIDIIRHTIIV